MLVSVLKRDTISDRVLASFEDLFKHFVEFITRTSTHPQKEEQLKAI